MMAKPKSEDIGTLPPAIFDLNTVSTPARSQSEANIDAKGYDPAWDEPNFGKTESPDSDRRPDVGTGGRGEDECEGIDREAAPVAAQVVEPKHRPFPNSALPIPNSESDPRWKPEQFGDREFVPEPDGQLTITPQDREPPEPDDYPTTEVYDRAWADWSGNREAAPVTAEVVEPESTAIDVELSYEEKRDRLHLERKVERAFYEAGRALRELRDRFSALRERSLDAIDLEILQLLERAVVLTPRELEHLEGIEGKS